MVISIRMVASVQLHQDAVFGLSRVNDDIIEAQKWVLESAGNLFRLQYETHSLQIWSTKRILYQCGC